MDKRSEHLSTAMRDRLFKELGVLGLAKVHIGRPANGQLSVKAVARPVPGEDELYFGFGVKGPFAYELNDAGDALVATRAGEWNPALVATQRTWSLLHRLRNLDPGVYPLPSPPPNEPPLLEDINYLFKANDEGEQRAANDLREVLRGITVGSPRYLTISHLSGLARDHIVMVDGFTSGQSAYAIDQNDGLYHRRLHQNRDGAHELSYLPGDPANFWPREQWNRLQVVSNLTFNRMPTPSTLSLELGS